MSGFAASANGAGDGRFGSLTPSRRAPPVPANSAGGAGPGSSFASRSQESFTPPLASYNSSAGSSTTTAPPLNRMNSAGSIPMGSGGGAGGGSYTGSLRPAGPGAVAPSSGQWSSGNGSPGGSTGGGIVRKGYVSVKEDGIRSWIWSKRWLALREQTLTFHKNEVSKPSSCKIESSQLIFLHHLSRRHTKLWL